MNELLISIKNHINKISPFWQIFTFALLIRLIYMAFNIPDYWGDAYHSVFINQSTVSNNWVYSDYSGREVVWMPFFRYVVSLFMYLFDTYELVIPHLINSIIGAFACSFTYVLVRKSSSEQASLLAALCLAILPWHIAYSNLNTPEVLSGFLIMSALIVWPGNKWFWLLPIGFVGVLTRNEVTLLLALLGVFLLYKKEWKPAISLLIGATLGLSIWGLWCYHKTGYFFWWISERNLGSSWNHLFQLQKGRALGVWYNPVLSIIQAFPIVTILAFVLVRYRKSVLKQLGMVDSTILPVMIILIFEWSFVFLMQYRYYSYPEPKYFIITLPLACAVTGYLIGRITSEFRNRIVKFTYIFAVIVLFLETPVFYFLPYMNDASRQVGYYLKESLPKEGNIWLDFTIAWYYSDIDISRMHSSYTLASRFDRYNEGFENDLRKNLDELDIRWVMSEPSSFTYVYEIWPEMKKLEAFHWKGLYFDPIYTYKRPKSLLDDPTMMDNLIDTIIPKNIQSCIWEIKRNTSIHPL